MMPGVVMPEMGDFILAHISGRGGALIRVLQGLNGDGFSDYEHAAVYLGQDVLVEMAAGGIQLVSASTYDSVPHRWSSGLIPLTGQNRHDITEAAQKYLALHIGYSWEDYAALAAHRFHFDIPGLRDYIKTSGHMICSQLVDQCYQDAGVQLFDDKRWPGDVTPGDLSLLLDAAGARH